MIADQKIFTAKKSQELRAGFGVVSVLIMVLTGLVVVGDSSLPVVLFAVLFLAGLLFSLAYVYRKSGNLLRQINHGKQTARRVDAELAGLRKSCAAKTLFIETAGAELLEASRAMYDAAEFLHARRSPDGKQLAGREIEEDLLENADWVYSFSRDIVTLTQLRKGNARLLEQEIDPVELVRFCASEVSKKLGKQQVIELMAAPDQQLLVKGDLSKLKQSLEKFLTWAVRQIEIDGAKVQISIFRDKASWLVFSVKLSGCHMNNCAFEKFCCPLDNFSKDSDQMVLDLAIARGLVKLHGGDIVIRKQTSSGTVLDFFLPGVRVSQIALVADQRRNLNRVIETVG